MEIRDEPPPNSANRTRFRRAWSILDRKGLFDQVRGDAATKGEGMGIFSFHYETPREVKYYYAPVTSRAYQTILESASTTEAEGENEILVAVTICDVAGTETEMRTIGWV